MDSVTLRLYAALLVLVEAQPDTIHIEPLEPTEERRSTSELNQIQRATYKVCIRHDATNSNR